MDIFTPTGALTASHQARVAKATKLCKSTTAFTVNAVKHSHDTAHYLTAKANQVTAPLGQMISNAREWQLWRQCEQLYVRVKTWSKGGKGGSKGPSQQERVEQERPVVERAWLRGYWGRSVADWVRHRR